jgi:hypothetical protein
VDRDAGAVIPVASWEALEDRGSVVVDPVWLAVDVAPDRSSASVAAAGLRADGLVHVEVVDRRPGTGWVADRVAELVARHEPVGVLVDAVSPAASLAESVAAEVVPAQGMARACGVFFDLVADAGLRHLGDPVLVAALKGARRRPLGDAWAWSRRASSVDISPLVAVTLAAQAVAAGRVSAYETRDLLVL